MNGAIDCDVFVAGLGPAGAAAAYEAARAGCHVIGIDRKRRAGQPVQCAELVPGLIGQHADGFTGQLHQPVQRMTTAIGQAPADETAPFPGFMIDRAAFDAARVALAVSAGAECHFGRAIRAVDDNGVILADDTCIRPRVVIGADGPLSIVGRALGQVNRELVYARQVSVPLLSASDATAIFLRSDYAGGYGWLFPAGTHAHVGIGVLPRARARLKPMLADLLRQLQSEGRVGDKVLRRTGGAIPVGGRLRAMARGDSRLTLLAGDAAGLTNPVTGAGIHAALVSGELAGQAAADYVAGDHDAGAAYEEELTALFDSALAHAVTRRRELWRQLDAGAGDHAAFRRGWIAYPEYWQRRASPRTMDEVCE